MTQQEFFKIWETKHPKSYNKFKIFLYDYYKIFIDMQSNPITYYDPSPIIGTDKCKEIKLSSKKLFEIIERFFIKNKIEGIYVIPKWFGPPNAKFKIQGMDIVEKKLKDIQNEVCMQAYLKAAEILEKESK